MRIFFSVNKAVICLFIILLTMGVLLVFGSSISYCVRNIVYFLSPKERRSSKGIAESLNRHLVKILSVIYDFPGGSAEETSALNRFYIISFTLASLPMIFLYKTMGMNALIAAAALALTPYGYIRIKLEAMQREGSFEGEVLIREIKNQYSYNYFNMMEALDSALANLPDEAVMSKRVLYKTNIKLHTYQSAIELTSILEEFRYAFGTQWAEMLTFNIYNAIENHANVASGLNDLLDVCQFITARIEKEKQGTSQIGQMTKVLSPILIVGSYYMAAKIITLDEVIRIQFKTSTGLTMFFAILATAAINYAVSSILGRPKFDM